MYLYIIRATNQCLYKIGISRSADKRLKELQTACPTKLRFIYKLHVNHPHAIEREVHKELRTKRIHGEWFNLTENEVKALPKIIRKLDKNWKPVRMKIKHMLNSAELDSIIWKTIPCTQHRNVMCAWCKLNGGV